MRLTRKQKRWIRKHRGLVNLIRILILVLVVCLCYFIATLFNEDLKLSNLLDRGNETNQENNNSSKEDSANSGQNEENNQGKNEGNNGQYISQLVVLDEAEEELTDTQKAALEYVPDPSVQKPYLIKVNRAANCVTVYGIDENGYYSIPVKAMVCSTGKNVGDTPLGNGSITNKYTFHPMVDGTYGQYAVRFMDGGILFHSVPYYTQNKNDLETDQFNLLGSVASLGCVRMCVRDVLWIYENCPEGTDVVVYDDTADPGPLGKPEMIKIPVNSQYAGWDPTDPDPSNPWAQYSAMINGADNVTLNVGDAFDPRNGVTAIDTCGNEITDRIKLSGSYDMGIPGTYTITYMVTDLIGSTDTKTITVTVVDPAGK